MESDLRINAEDNILSSWKEIALYMGKGVRTVQRWEQDFGLPVHRGENYHRKAILARSTELDAWTINLCITRSAPLGITTVVPASIRKREQRLTKPVPANERSQFHARSVLTSWKEIAQYLGCGVRTVQRWEIDFGLPVRRPRGCSKKAILARTCELEDWLNSWPNSAPEKNSAGTTPPSIGSIPPGEKKLPFDDVSGIGISSSSALAA